MQRISRAVLSLLIIISIFIAALPGIAYVAGLSRIEGRPNPAEPTLYSRETINSVWQQCREVLPVEVEPINPWGLTSSFIFENPFHTTPGQRAAWRIASTYNSAHPVGGNIWWHTSGAALTIWITRHWSAEQIGATLVRDNLCKARPNKALKPLVSLAETGEAGPLA